MIYRKLHRHDEKAAVVDSKLIENRKIYKREETDNETNKFSNYKLVQHSNKDLKIKTKRIITNWCSSRSTGGERSS